MEMIWLIVLQLVVQHVLGFIAALCQACTFQLNDYYKSSWN